MMQGKKKIVKNIYNGKHTDKRDDKYTPHLPLHINYNDNC